jgi:hypothetical protein
VEYRFKVVPEVLVHGWDGGREGSSSTDQNDADTVRALFYPVEGLPPKVSDFLNKVNDFNVTLFVNAKSHKWVFLLVAFT